MGKGKRRLIALLSVFITISIIIFVGCFYAQSLKIQAIPRIEDPSSFTRDFDPAGKTSTNFEIKSKGFSGRVVRSPYFPNKELETTTVEAYKCPKRYVNTDKFWKIFWVEIANCEERTEFFGPYRFSGVSL